MAKNKILIDATGNEGWIGGVYYKNNIIFSLTRNEWVSENYKIVIVTNKEFEKVFDFACENIKLICIKYSNRREKQLKILLISIFEHCKYIYHGSEEFYKYFGKTMIRWIPDFQHIYFPENFTSEEVEKRNKEFQRIAFEKNPIVLSSRDALETFLEKYSPKYSNIYVVPFVSYISPLLEKITKVDEEKCLDVYGLLGQRYVCIMNQFWKHKNHEIVLRAIKELYNVYDDDAIYIFTGKLEDYRNPDYIAELKKIMTDHCVATRIKLLGFIDRKDQLILMKNSMYVIQPSLFEGWGTVVEDAKVLDKTILLSDIPIHREQGNCKCIFFNPYKASELAELIKIENGKKHFDNTEQGLKEMSEKALEYSLGFQELLQH